MSGVNATGPALRCACSSGIPIAKVRSRAGMAPASTTASLRTSHLWQSQAEASIGSPVACDCVYTESVILLNFRAQYST